MIRYVLDVSVGIKWFLPEVHSEAAGRLPFLHVSLKRGHVCQSRAPFCQSRAPFCQSRAPFCPSRPLLAFPLYPLCHSRSPPLSFPPVVSGNSASFSSVLSFVCPCMENAVDSR